MSTFHNYVTSTVGQYLVYRLVVYYCNSVIIPGKGILCLNEVSRQLPRDRNVKTGFNQVSKMYAEGDEQVDA